MYLLVIYLPLLGSIISGFLGIKLGGIGSAIFSTSCIAIATFIAYFIFYEVGLAGSPCYVELFPWFDSGMFSVNWGFQFDTLTAVMLIVVLTVSFFVHIYSTEYMQEDPHLSRFMSYLSLFTFFMLMLVTSDNIIQMFLGWEGVGVCSYLLINFWYGRIQANKAALKAMIVNKIGDFGLSVAIFLMYISIKGLNYSLIFATIPSFYNTEISIFNTNFLLIDVIGFFLLLAAVGKSAQIGLHTWLPDAMEGPTPVSALIHAATMVTAGVFLLARFSPLLEYTTCILPLITCVGAMTAFMAATTGLFQNDLKRIIAYSTCSQLGYMVFACGLSNYAAGIFHLTNHAFFKALLFMSAGSVIHGMGDEQDMRRMGGLVRILPFTYSMLFVGSLALMGFPFLAGFYSKDVILESAFGSYTVSGHFAYWLGSLSAFFTAFYSFRLISLTFLRPTNSYKTIIMGAHEPSFRMVIPLFCLSFFSIFSGYLLKDMMIGLGTNFWGNSLFVLPDHLILIEAEQIPLFYKNLPLILSLGGAGLAYVLYNQYYEVLYKIKTSYIGRHLYTFFNRKWFFDKVYNEFINQKVLDFGYKNTYQNMDRGILEMVGPNGLAVSIYRNVFIVNNIQTKFIFHYIFIYFLFILVILISLSWAPIFLKYIDIRIVCLLLINFYFLMKRQISSS